MRKRILPYLFEELRPKEQCDNADVWPLALNAVDLIILSQGLNLYYLIARRKYFQQDIDTTLAFCNHERRQKSEVSFLSGKENCWILQKLWEGDLISRFAAFLGDICICFAVYLGSI